MIHWEYDIYDIGAETSNDWIVANELSFLEFSFRNINIFDQTISHYRWVNKTDGKCEYNHRLSHLKINSFIRQIKFNYYL